MTHDDAFKEVLTRSAAMLREERFRGSGQNYKRVLGEIWQGVNFQRSQWRLAKEDTIRFTVNLYVHFPKLRMKRWTPPPVSFEKYALPRSDQSLRVGRFLPEPVDEWWEVDGDEVERLWEGFEPVMRRTVLPAMEELSTRDGVAGIMRRMPWMVMGATAR